MKHHSDQRWTGVTYAQHGDDIMILNIFELLEIQKPNYLDIGAHHPSIISNTKLLYERGSRGVNIDANADVGKLFAAERPDDKFVAVGIGPASGTFKFHVYGRRSGLNTFCDAEVESLSGFAVSETVDLEVITINDAVNRYCSGVWPDLLSIDIEGWDQQVLEDADMDHYTRPQLIVVETRRKNSKNMIHTLSKKGFQPVVRMGENLFFVHRSDYMNIW